MRDYTNLQWPEEPFGAQQRPFGKPSDTLAAFAVDWAPRRDAAPLPVAVAAVYLRARRHGTAVRVADDALSIGFRATIIDDPSDTFALLGIVDRALTRARRHAIIVAGFALDADLGRMLTLSPTPLRGVAGVADAWANRSAQGRGMALMVDVAAEAAQAGAVLDMATHPVPSTMPHSVGCEAALARTVLARTVAIGLTAAVYTGRYRWDGTFRIANLLDRQAWDVLAGESVRGPDTATTA